LLEITLQIGHQVDGAGGVHPANNHVGINGLGPDGGAGRHELDNGVANQRRLDPANLVRLDDFALVDVHGDESAVINVLDLRDAANGDAPPPHRGIGRDARRLVNQHLDLILPPERELSEVAVPQDKHAGNDDGEEHHQSNAELLGAFIHK
jgi:hypothetical protein